MRNNVHTIHDFNNDNSMVNINNLSDDNQLASTLRMLGNGEGNTLFTKVNALDRLAEQHKKFNEEHGCSSSSMADSFPDIYPQTIDSETAVISLFDIFFKILSKIQNSTVDIDSLSEQITTQNVNPSIFNLERPLGAFGDITLNQIFESFNFSFLIENAEVLVMPSLGVTYGLVYSTSLAIAKIFFKHLEPARGFNQTPKLDRDWKIRIRRANLAVLLSIAAPPAGLASILIVNIA
jgi:hypothetical protein